MNFTMHALWKIIIISSRYSQLCNQYVTVKFSDYKHAILNPPKSYEIAHGSNAEHVSLHCRMEMEIMMMSTVNIALHCAPLRAQNRICPSNKLMETGWQMTTRNIIIIGDDGVAVVAVHADYTDVYCSRWARI